MSRRTGLAGVFAYSVPALVWFAVTLACWLLLLVVTGDPRIDWTAIREVVRRRRLALAVTAMLVVAAAALTVGRLSEFVERIGDVSASTEAELPYGPAQAIGVGRDTSAWYGATSRGLCHRLPAGVIAAGTCCFAAAPSRPPRRSRGVGLSRRTAVRQRYSRQALAVLAPWPSSPLGGLFADRIGGNRGCGARRRVPRRCCRSTFLALRAAPVGFDDRGEELEELAERAEGKRVAFLGVDRFAGYWLRETLAASPGGYVPVEVRARREKVWQRGRAMDLDTLWASRLDRFEFAITTTAAYQSSPAPNMRGWRAHAAYVLWKREGRHPLTQVLHEEGRPALSSRRRFEAQSRSRAGKADAFPGRHGDRAPRPVVGGARRGAARCRSTRTVTRARS